MRVLAVGIVVALTIMAPHVSAQGLKIGYVNGFRVENESATALRAFEILKKEFTPRERELRQLEKRVAEMKTGLEKTAKTAPLAERLAREKVLRGLISQLRQSQQNFAEDLEVRRREEHTRLISAANVAIKAVAESSRYDLIIQESVYSNPRIDITRQVLDEMAKRLNQGAPIK